MELSEPEKAWLACAVDTDGHIGLKLQSASRHKGGKIYHYKYVMPIIGFSNTHEGIVDKFSKLIEAKPYKSKQGKPYEKRPIFRVSTQNTRKIYEILIQILPYLIAKKERASFAYTFCHYKLDNPGDHTQKSSRNEADLEWLETYRSQFSSKKTNRGL